MGTPVSRITLSALAALAAGAVCAVPATADSGLNTISVRDHATITRDGRVTLSGVYRCAPGSPEGVQIQTLVRQDGDKRLGMGAGSAACDGAVHEWSVTGTVGVAPGLHPGAAETEARLTATRAHGHSLVPTSFSQDVLAQDGHGLTIDGH
ncbi:DUF6299 family protein [Streptomyces sp. G-G2]|uniref:DUF6299 family protein n=1 Tax=Streptomyces sp. G-G2 TaxID=3046201 RepID=UPI0024B98493|nr:DUF6299 family protein [Streptomyces sp. G-G2]MDJ0380516.1 DUF6299 family protein [Streptomyces sp. G-G2]